ncbi:MAG: hypothetical protein ACYCSP_06160, partial [Acidobacteriaceae bacterium]
ALDAPWILDIDTTIKTLFGKQSGAEVSYNPHKPGRPSHAFSEVRDYVEMKVRTLLTRRKRRRKTSIGWRRWSNEYLYGVLGLYWNWKVQPLPGVERMP